MRSVDAEVEDEEDDEEEDKEEDFSKLRLSPPSSLLVFSGLSALFRRISLATSLGRRECGTGKEGGGREEEEGEKWEVSEMGDSSMRESEGEDSSRREFEREEGNMWVGGEGGGRESL